MLLFNPATDRQSKDLNKVFFTASHVFIAMGIGYGLTLAAATLLLQYERFRTWILAIGAALSAVGLFTLVATFVKFSGGQATMGGLKLVFHATRQALERGHFRPEICAGLLLLGLTVVFLALVLVCRTRIRLLVVMCLFTLMPVTSILFHWADNEQHGHLFGFWFGHDMFTPPFPGPDGKLTYDPKLRAELLKKPEGAMIYPEMARDTVLFGGTDPGRFCPTYMIFCESFIPPHKRRDEHFDRRDVYIITQNALADGTYLQYIRAHYNRSTQIDPPFFQEVFRGEKERELNYRTNLLARMFSPLDTFFLGLGRRIEERRRAEGVYPSKEISTPSNEDSGRAFQEYLDDAQRRMKLGQLKPGEDIKIVENRMQVQGQVAVMSINGLLTKVIFDKNPDHEFYVEESFPLDWMYPHLEPFGIIMKINRKPLQEMSEQMIARDHLFWSLYSDRLIGNWITYDTSIADVCKFAERTYVQHNYQGFKGDPRFVRDNDGQKAFSKLRSSIGGVYAWRVDNASPPGSAQQKAMVKEAEFALKQAYAFCPYSPEALFRLSNLLLGMARYGENRIDDARLLAETSLKMDPYNGQIENLLKELDRIKKSTASLNQVQVNIARFEREFQAKPADPQTAYNLISNLAQVQSTGRILQVLDQMLTNPAVDANGAKFVAQVAQQLNNLPHVESALEVLVRLEPENPEAWYDLAGIRAMQTKSAPALESLGKALQLNTARLAKSPGVPNLMTQALADARFNAIRQTPEFLKLLTPK
jgi:tetratricopeptide (TPR) repeat protein